MAIKRLMSLEGEAQTSNTLSSNFPRITVPIVRQTLASSDSIIVMHISQFFGIATVALVFGATAAPLSHLVTRDAALNARSYSQTIRTRNPALNAWKYAAEENERREASLDPASSYYQCTSNAKREATVEKREAALNACRFEAAAEKREAEPESLEALMEKRDAALDAANSYSQVICTRNPALNACKYTAEEKVKREAAPHSE